MRTFNLRIILNFINQIKHLKIIKFNNNHIKLQIIKFITTMNMRPNKLSLNRINLMIIILNKYIIKFLRKMIINMHKNFYLHLI